MKLTEDQLKALDGPWMKSNGGMLDPEKHARLIGIRDSIARDGRFPVELLWRPLPEGLTKVEVDWLKKFRSHRAGGKSGLLITGPCVELDPLARMGAMAGFLSRNFVRARIFSLEEVLDSDDVEATCLLIPDFLMGGSARKETSWRVSRLSALLMDRWRSEGLSQTVLYAPSVGEIAKEYGSFIGNLVKNHYVTVAA